MSKLDWNMEYSVGIEFIDKQHQHLFDLINRFESWTESGKSKDDVMSVFDDILSYTVTHFSEEEQMMIDNGYPDIAEHHQRHQELIDAAKKLRADYDKGESGAADAATLFLQHWLTGHIQKTDMKYAPLMHEKGVH